ncbi:MAG TPA: hypothetical protein VEG27_06040 [Usitatibacter sp.]|nr:hypothetical protein [Usitatibacter sp.]
MEERLESLVEAFGQQEACHGTVQPKVLINRGIVPSEGPARTTAVPMFE